MAMGPNAFWEAMQNGGVVQPQAVRPSSAAQGRMRQAESRRAKRLKDEEVATALAERRRRMVQESTPEQASALSAKARPLPPSPVVEPPLRPGSSVGSFYGQPALPGRWHPREAALDAHGQYLRQLRGAVDWNNLVHEYSLPLPTKNVPGGRPEFAALEGRGYFDPHVKFSVSPETQPEEFVNQYQRRGGEWVDSYGQKAASPILSRHPAYSTSDGPVYLGAPNPFELSPSPYTFSEFAKAMQSRVKRW